MSANHSNGRPFTGRHMLLTMVGFFGVIIAVNVTMAVLANTSWSGFVVRNSYVAGLEFNRKAEEARAQEMLGWASTLRIEEGEIRFSLSDRQAEPVRLEGGTATLRRPASDTEDMTVTLLPSTDGRLAAPLDVRDGVWLIEIVAQDGRETPWHEIERVIVREGTTR